MMFRIIQISDLHIPDNNLPMQGVELRKQFDLLLKKIAHEQFDLLVISGDLAYSAGNENIYKYIQEKLQKIPQPKVFMPGNHDSIELMQSFFNIESEVENELFFTKKTKYDTLLFLDTSSGLVSEQQLSWIENTVSHISKRIIIFSHHPVLFSNTVFMDKKHSLKNRSAVQNILQKTTKPIFVFCGHFHTDLVVVENNITQFICPSNFCYTDTNSDSFVIESVQTGYRIIDISMERISSRTKNFKL